MSRIMAYYKFKKSEKLAIIDQTTYGRMWTRSQLTSREDHDSEFDIGHGDLRRFFPEWRVRSGSEFTTKYRDVGAYVPLISFAPCKTTTVNETSPSLYPSFVAIVLKSTTAKGWAPFPTVLTWRASSSGGSDTKIEIITQLAFSKSIVRLIENVFFSFLWSEAVTQN